MATVEKDVYEGLSLELILEQKITTFFADMQTQIAQIYTIFAEKKKNRTRNVRF